MALDKRVIQTIQFNNVVINIQKNVKSGLSKILFRRIEENFPFWTEKKKKKITKTEYVFYQRLMNETVVSICHPWM